MRISTAVLIITVLGAMAGRALPQAGDAGSSGLAFLKLGVGARAAAVGEAYTALTRDATATFWNPAGLASLHRPQVSFTHTEWLQGINNEYFAFAFPGFGGTVGLSIYSNNVGDIERRVGPSAEPLGQVSANDLALGVSYGLDLSSNLAAGVSVKYLYERIFVESVSGYAFDLGLSLTPFEVPLTIAAVVQNLGSMGTLLNESVELPRTIRLGGAYEVSLGSKTGVLTVSADLVKVRETDLRTNLGAELALRRYLALRLGYQSGFDDKALGGGFGLNFDRYFFDYGFTPFDSNFGDTHRLSFRLDL